jgi:hypothetical protein
MEDFKDSKDEADNDKRFLYDTDTGIYRELRK